MIKQFIHVSLFSVWQVITEELGMNLDKVDLEMLGSCKKVSQGTTLNNFGPCNSGIAVNDLRLLIICL